MFRFSSLALLAAWVPVVPLLAQTSVADTTARAVALPEATVTGYGQRLPLRRTAAAIGVLDAGTIQQFNPAALTQAVNTLPGVRLEERATASYRLSIRGSTLRSPFGVRNVKVYYNGIPFTEAGGSTPLNLLDPALIGRLEVLKGPAGSVYGAGTGGVARFGTPEVAAGTSRVAAGATVGSYGLRRATLTAETGSATSSVRAQYAHQELDGYRQQSALRRDVFALDVRTVASPKTTLAAHLLYADINYQLPGGLTRAQFEADPRQARPGTATAPGTVAQQAFYASRTGLLGLTHEYRFSDKLELETTLYGSGTAIRTPYLVDYERNTGLGLGGRSALSYRTALAGRVLRLQGGGEFQAGFTDGRSYQNNGGTPGALRYNDEITTTTGFAFAQADYSLPADLLLTVAASYNRLRYGIARVSNAATQPNAYQFSRDFRPEVSPRVALLKEFNLGLSVYASVSTGFAPPTVEEIRPSDASLNGELQAERGTSYEVGTRGSFFQNRLRYELTVFDFELRQTITSSTTDQGIVVFRNAGHTRQRGFEAALSGWLWQQPQITSVVYRDSTKRMPRPEKTGLRAWASYAYNDFRFRDYPGRTDLLGKRLTGSTPHTLSAGLELTERLGFYFSPNLSHQARVVLNDFNTDTAPGYWVFGARGGWRRTLAGHLETDVFAGLDNATNRRYSLGNDLNAFGGRYFQPAPGRAWYAGVQLSWRW
ncbi:TonB-dependent receptor family protein [Hymenobacter properus]|uniref:TonB-dependent receptor plug domain-containing protein n=1 Tax=Hymenobacter properus TaxID=2791026 RepID=A0A931FLQ5_9BACT|nr:TonB-dependent receptor [Hymenobacter properus]MBF9140924.1 TonB-dependent receptor plug domain-containing protein [Hymenobacter properus]MBR7719733.1 TonB-dependent receptor plug domain-containing protein [Microvirga sp. SRT04]